MKYNLHRKDYHEFYRTKSGDYFSLCKDFVDTYFASIKQFPTPQNIIVEIKLNNPRRKNWRKIRFEVPPWYDEEFSDPVEKMAALTMGNIYQLLDIHYILSEKNNFKPVWIKIYENKTSN